MTREKSGLSQFFAACAIVVMSVAVGVAQDGEPAKSAQAGAVSDSGEDAFEMIDHPIAILPFKTRGKEVSGMGEKISDLMFAQLIVDPTLNLVDREDLSTVLTEAELNISGVVNPQQATQIGQLTGAKLLVTGSVFQVDDSIYVVSKIIGTETTRVIGASVKGSAEGKLDKIVKKLGREVITSIQEKSSKLMPEMVNMESRIKKIKAQLEGLNLPTVFVDVTEQHVGETTIDPAAQTELIKIFKECGFEVIDSEAGSKAQAKIVISGEGISEFATRKGNLISVKARLEVKAVERTTDRVVAIDRQTRLAVGLAEQITGKQALQLAAADIAERLILAIAND